jgi:hypothetical protein
MNETGLKLLVDLGVSGLSIFLLYRLADRWAGLFKDSQRELLLAVRVVAAKQEEIKSWLRELAGERKAGRREEANNE